MRAGIIKTMNAAAGATAEHTTYNGTAVTAQSGDMMIGNTLLKVVSTCSSSGAQR